MQFIRNNSLFKKSILGFLMVLMFLAPVSISVTAKASIRISEQTSVVVLTSNHAHAEEMTPEEKKELDDKAVAAAKTDSGGFWGKMGSSLGAWLGNAVLEMAALVTWVGGRLLEEVTKSLVFGMGDWVAKGAGLGNAIDNTWEILRDICNLIFIFGFIYTGIRTILDPESAETKRFVAKIIIAALLINFSLFFVKMVIDFSNFAAYQIYISMVEGSGTLSAKIADTLGIITIWGPSAPETLANITKGGSFSFFMMAALFLIIAAFVFIGAAVLLISRFVTLIYIMVASPVLFAATIFPQTEEYASNLWHKLISAAFFAPAYFLLTLISIRLLEGIPLKGTVRGGSLVTALNPIGDNAVQADSFEIILFFVLAIFFLISSLTIAHSMGIKGSEMVIKKTKSAIGASTAGLAAKAFRATAGQYAHDKAEDGDWKEKKAKSWIGRQQIRLAQTAADTSFDARKVAGVGNAMGIGEGRKGGYATVLKEVKKKEEEFAKSLGEVDDTDMYVAQRKAEKEQQEKELRDLQIDLRAEKDPAKRKKINDAIAHKKHDIHEAQVKYEQEKMRRQTGSTFGTSPEMEAALKAHEQHLSDSEHAEKHAWEAFTASQSDLRKKINDPQTTAGMKALYQAQMDQEVELHRANIKTLMDNTKAAKKAREKFVSENMGGYASVLENSGHIVSFLEGRTASQNRESGKAIRKARKKGKPHDSGDHGGGHAPAHAPAPSAGGGGHGPAAGGAHGHGHP